MRLEQIRLASEGEIRSMELQHGNTLNGRTSCNRGTSTISAHGGPMAFGRSSVAGVDVRRFGHALVYPGGLAVCRAADRCRIIH
jgi:hypothetical protein